jgi:ectoine hydroxylase-related dioxygenase (phytanoyl-CoA dioxygenase family)
MWTCAQEVRAHGTSGKTPDGDADAIVLHGLGLNLLETYRFLYGATGDFDAFEQWVLEKNGGEISAERIARINAALNEDSPSASDGSALEPVFSAEEMRFWDEHGYVILHDAVSAEQCKAAVDVLCDHLKVRLDDPETWYTTGIGASIMVELVHRPALDANRNSERIRRAFAQIWGTDDLFMTNDRCGFNPPERHDWRFPGPNLHWDTSLTQPIPLGTQGILYLTDTEAEQGAFTCVPGFHRRIEAWIESLPPGANPRNQDMEALGPVPIAGRAGDLVIWHQALPHGSRPNRATRPRWVQYINMYPPNLVDKRAWK